MTKTTATGKPASSLRVMKGINQPGQINPEITNTLKRRGPGKIDVDEFLSGIFSGNRTILSQAITLVESSRKDHQEKAQEIIAGCLRRSTNYQLPITNKKLASQREHRTSPDSVQRSGIRIGITGVPGVGKSTFIEALGKYLTARGHKVAVLAVDPSSSRSKGSILGDKTRMETLAVDPNAFIRPSPSAGSLGGVTRKTRETILLCEAAGYDVIFVETVGVGQSESAVHSMTDFFLLLMLAGAGDELQGIKRGIIEMADALFINKADGDNIERAKIARSQMNHALHYFPPSESGWTPPVRICSALSGEGMENAWKIVCEYTAFTRKNGYFSRKRVEQNIRVLHDAIDEKLRSDFYAGRVVLQKIRKAEEAIREGKVNPYAASRTILKSSSSENGRNFRRSS